MSALSRFAVGGAAAAAALTMSSEQLLQQPPIAQGSGSSPSRSTAEQQQRGSPARSRISAGHSTESLAHAIEHVIHHEHPLSDALHIKPNPFLLDRASLAASAARVASPQKQAVGGKHVHDHAALSHALHVPPNPFGL
jgi:hypothetical protein